MDTLSTVLCCLDMLDDRGNKDKSEHGCLLVLGKQGWQMEMARWIGISAKMCKIHKELNINIIY